ncbi:hypothetical protein MNV_750004 [Candidatus Methanoperedens nitroreducens]|uniref:Uncharacterized protein n=1 Tax=Candidatus Methanoperedens nitratireducens TaxID=1392998 RepID=A0A284VTG1_9EURY|nr:hypothetical protein MNV_750004 [Candidatus Methanoperedens nitroreducens]
MKVTMNEEVTTAFLISNPRTRRSGTIKVPPPMPTREDIAPTGNPATAPNTFFLFSFAPAAKPRLLKKRSLRLAKKSTTESSTIRSPVSACGARYEPVTAPRMDVMMIGIATSIFTSRCARYVVEAEAVVIAFRRSAIGIAVRRGSPVQKKSGV